MKHIGQVFGEFDSDSNAMIVLEGDQPLGADAHQFYATLVKKLSADTTHVEHVQDFWGDPLTAAGSQSKDGKAALVQLYLRGNQGESQSNESVDAIRKIVADTPPPPGVKAYVTGAAPLTTDTFEVGSSENLKITAVTFGVIAVMLLVVYRSIVTMILMLMTVMVELSAARGVVAALANSGVISLSTYTTNLLTLLAIAAGADYVIFVVGRYQEARSAGEEREAAYYTMFRGDRPRHHRFGADHRRGGGLPELHPAALLPEPRRARRPRRAGGAGGRAHPGPRDAGDGQPLRAARAQARDAHPRLAAHRHGHRAVARSRSRRVDRAGPDRPARAPWVQDQISMPARMCPPRRLRPSGTRLPNATSPRRGSTPSC